MQEPEVAADVLQAKSSQFKFEIDDEVVVVSKHGDRVKGRVRWSGKHKGVEVLGIEPVS